MLEKRLADDGRSVVVTFSHPIADGIRSVALVGDFNDWSTDAHPMSMLPSASTCEVTLEAGRCYRFRYLVDREHWENDWQADAYQPNSFGADDSVLDLTSPPATDAPPTAAPAKKKAVAKKAPAKKASTKKAAPTKAAAKKAAARPRKQTPPAE